MTKILTVFKAAWHLSIAILRNKMGELPLFTETPSEVLQEIVKYESYKRMKAYAFLARIELSRRIEVERRYKAFIT